MGDAEIYLSVTDYFWINNINLPINFAILSESTRVIIVHFYKLNLKHFSLLISSLVVYFTIGFAYPTFHTNMHFRFHYFNIEIIIRPCVFPTGQKVNRKSLRTNIMQNFILEIMHDKLSA